MRTPYILCLLIFGLIGPIFGQNASKGALLLDKASPLNLEAYSGFYIDTSGTLSHLEVLNKALLPLNAFPADPNLDHHDYWLRVDIQSEIGHATDWRFYLFDDWCESVQVFSKELGATEWLRQDAGYLCPIDELDQNDGVDEMIPKMPNAVSLHFAPGEEKTILIHYFRRNRPYLYMTPRIVPMSVAANELIDYDRAAFFIVLFMGMLGVLAIYHGSIYLMTGDLAYLYYSLYGACAAFAATVMDEYGWLTYHLFYSDNPAIQPWVFNTVGVLVVLCYILFTRSFLETKKRFPKVDFALKALLVWGIFAGTVGVFNFIITDRQYIPSLPFSSFLILIAGVFIILLIDVWKARRGTDLFYLAGLGVMLLIILPEHLIILTNWGNASDYLRFLDPLNPAQVGLIIELLVFSLGLAYRSRQVALEKQRFEELDQMKSHFFANISHEFRTPLTLILGPLKDLKDKLKEPKDKRQLEVAHQNASRLLQLINQLLDLSKLETKKMQMNPEELNFAAFLKGIVMSFESLASRKNIRLHFVSQKEQLILAVDKDKMEKIFYNLLSNAFKFTNDHGEVSVMLVDQKKQIQVLVRDNGIGISAARLPQIFDRFFQVNETNQEYEGSGIGLALVKELVAIHAGTITVESTEGSGTTFTITLPKSVLKTNPVPDNGQAFAERPALEIEEPPLDVQDIDTTVGLWKGKAPVVLIIEDNRDVRQYIKQHLTKNFKVLEAQDGEEGVNLAYEYMPDLIISDVMMPRKNGYEVCQTLKSDPRTSHIPIILLTAKAGQEEKLKGLETGADDYLLKPFETRELEVRVRNLIEIRKALRERFSNKSFIDASDIKINSVDEQFLESVCTSIETHLSDSQYNVEVLAAEVGMSKGHLNRKLNALTDQSANKFIQAFRLDQAKRLLEQKAGNVSEIALKTGFNSTAYFVKCFGDKYGQTPGSILQD